MEVGKSGFSSYSPISTLARQYDGPIGRRILLFVRTNPNCCIQMETVLKAGKSASNNTAALSQESGLTDRSSEYEEDSDPFSFLGDSGGNAIPEDTTTNATGGKKPNFGRFIKRVAKSTTKSLERGVQNLAIRADQGKNPDLLVVGIYQGNELLCMTDSQPALQTPQGLHFTVPLVIPGSLVSEDELTVKLWIRSGAAILQNSIGAKNYLIGYTHLKVGTLRHMLQASGVSFFASSLQSTLIVDGKLQFCATTDLKMPALGGRGWSLADPSPSGYESGMFNFPLDMSYAYKFPPKPNCSLIASERAIESTIVLPIATAFAQMASDASKISLAHAEGWKNILHASRHDSEVGEYVKCSVGISSLNTDMKFGHGSFPTLTAAWQRPDSIFEVELLGPYRIPVQTVGVSSPSVSFTFFPKPVREGILPSLIQANGSLPPIGFMLGSIRFYITIHRPSTSRAAAGQIVVEEEHYEGVLELDRYLQGKSQVEVPIQDPQSKIFKGKIQISLDVHTKQGTQNVPKKPPSSVGGLVALVGLENPYNIVLPCFDRDDVSTQHDHSLQTTLQQLATMGHFISFQFLEHHLKTMRRPDVAIFEERAAQYGSALVLKGAQAEKLPPNEDRTPRPFRPSSSRSTLLLSGLPFNVHTASYSLNIMDPDRGGQPSEGALFYNITHGAPADHARGFGNVFPKRDNSTADFGLNSPVGPVTGGLRRLEMKRADIIKSILEIQNSIVTKISNFFNSERTVRSFVTHVPARHAELQGLRFKLYEAVQSLYHVTWVCAVRRASTFSQTLGLAVTSLLASISDYTKWQSTWPEFWTKHGYLVCFEGLLSAAGKELGMIEDAYVAIDMLRNARVIFSEDDGSSSSGRIPIPHSPYLQWMSLSATGGGATVQYTLEIGLIPSYYRDRIPTCMKNGGIRFYPVLFEVGVDIRQWGAYAGSNVKNQFNKGDSSSEKEPAGGLIDDEDDDIGVSDEDVLVQLNYEAFRKLNSYAFAISPAAPVGAQLQQQSSTGGSGQVPNHPLLETLHRHIVSSAGKMNHDILDEAAQLAQQLGGGGLVFCKSGKDRTAMHVTYKMSQFANTYRKRGVPASDMDQEDETLANATTMRVYGTRLPICEKNVGESKYAFNSLQVKFMPTALKPPMNTLAGFLKGGKIFTGGAIES